MPIKKENKHRYPKEWPAIRAQVLTRAAHKCEQCGVPNHCVVTKQDRRVVSSRELRDNGITIPNKMNLDTQCLLRRLHFVWIVLTIHHRDANPTNNDGSNLVCLCQKCHNRYDVEHRAETRKATIAQKMGKSYPGWQQPLYVPEQEIADEH